MHDRRRHDGRDNRSLGTIRRLTPDAEARKRWNRRGQRRHWNPSRSGCGGRRMDGAIRQDTRKDHADNKGERPRKKCRRQQQPPSSAIKPNIQSIKQQRPSPAERPSRPKRASARGLSWAPIASSSARGRSLLTALPARSTVAETGLPLVPYPDRNSGGLSRGTLQKLTYFTVRQLSPIKSFLSAVIQDNRDVPTSYDRSMHL